jgi:hypothetical protein
MSNHVYQKGWYPSITNIVVFIKNDICMGVYEDLNLKFPDSQAGTFDQLSYTRRKNFNKKIYQKRDSNPQRIDSKSTVSTNSTILI